MIPWAQKFEIVGATWTELIKIFFPFMTNIFLSCLTLNRLQISFVSVINKKNLKKYLTIIGI